ncbi:uncharacterized protein MAM_07247 [Metarhizium album ARSEF 1941]|uniref:Secreted protein n=1 Tax=Metarhizium album (strain ARSEF 1941) TaxID=1081103 RepID=A0A0B2WLM7_METAS|nr:uncharacterized protein MAM_07247 [Metarhizium album ARSEF 1941]KHN94828.1 hypothetical protein MAM_07247 [Metarhizium album ARSEF 1941]
MVAMAILMSPSAAAAAAAPLLLSTLQESRSQNVPYDAHQALLALERPRHVPDEPVHGLPVRAADLPRSVHIPAPRTLRLPSEHAPSRGPPVFAYVSSVQRTAVGVKPVWQNFDLVP